MAHLIESNEPTQRCYKCETKKPLSEFHKDRRKPNGKQSMCKNCFKLRNAKFRSENSDYFKKKSKTHYHIIGKHENKERYQKYREDYLARNTANRTTVAGKLTELYRAARSRAQSKNLEFTITTEWVFNQLEKQNRKCAITQLPFTAEINQNGERFYAPFNPSLDRINCALGYTPENTRIVCTIVNLALNKFGDEIFDTMCRAYVTNNP